VHIDIFELINTRIPNNNDIKIECPLALLLWNYFTQFYTKTKNKIFCLNVFRPGLKFENKFVLCYLQLKRYTNFALIVI